jgi:hypothetical protein
MEVRSMSFTIDCETCPVRGRHCGDCFVPVLARAWLEDPQRVTPPEPEPAPPEQGASLALDFEETEALEAFVHAGLISRADVRGVRAQSTTPWVAVG